MKYPSVHASRLEKWLGRDQVEAYSENFRNWYGPPIPILDVPGRGIYAHGGGDFSGHIHGGQFACAMDAAADIARRIWRGAGQHPRIFGAGFSSLSDLISRASAGHQQSRFLSKLGSTGVASACSSLWLNGNVPPAASAPSSAPGGNAPTSATTGAIAFTNPASSNLRLTGADMSASLASNGLMLYDRIFHVAKTMNSTATEAVTGVPTRYQSTTSTNEDYAGGNFLFIEVGATPLAATAHNWTTCLYTDQDNNTGQTLPSVTGNSGAIANRFDMPTNTFFAPLATGDTGIKALTQMQCSAAVATGTINFVIARAIGIFSFPIASLMLPFDYVTNRNITPKIFDDACLALFEMPKPSTSGCTYNGVIYATATA